MAHNEPAGISNSILLLGKWLAALPQRNASGCAPGVFGCFVTHWNDHQLDQLDDAMGETQSNAYLGTRHWSSIKGGNKIFP